MPTLTNYLYNESIGVTSDNTTSLTLTFLNIIPSTSSTDTIIKSGDVVNVICSDTGALISFTANADVNFNSTRLQFASTAVNQIIPAGSLLLMNRENKYNTLFRDYTIVTHKLYESGNSHGNTALINPRYPSIMDINGGSTWSNGDSLANSYVNNSIFRSPHNGCKIERITWDINTDATTGHNGVFELWQKRIIENGNNASLISLVDSIAFTSQNDANYVFNRDVQLTNTLADSECLIPSFRKTGSASSSDNFYATITLLISTDPRQ
jgi:hypothetical protein